MSRKLRTLYPTVDPRLPWCVHAPNTGSCSCPPGQCTLWKKYQVKASVFHVGERYRLDQQHQAVTVTLADDGIPVVEVGGDYVVFDQGDSRVRVPVYLMKEPSTGDDQCKSAISL